MKLCQINIILPLLAAIFLVGCSETSYYDEYTQNNQPYDREKICEDLSNKLIPHGNHWENQVDPVHTQEMKAAYWAYGCDK